MKWSKYIWVVISKAANDWIDDNAMRMGAALAFYSVLSLAPLSLIAVGLAGAFLNETDARRQLMGELERFVGKEAADAIRPMLDQGTRPQGIVATLLGTVTLIFGASGAFAELQSALNAVWDVKPKRFGVIEAVRTRFLSFIVVLGTGLLLVASLLVSAAIAELQNSVQGVVPRMAPLWSFLYLLGTFGVVTLLFAMIYKLLPDTPVAWRDVWAGALLTAILFTIGKSVIGFYLSRSGIASGYGAAGSLVILIVWVYYSAQILIFGAEITHAMAEMRSPPINGSR